jgi:signal transduction histidine kinase
MADEDRARLLDRDVKAQEFAERLLGIVGHDLRNPLSAVVTSASTLSRVLTAPDQQKRVKQILSSAGRMERIISNLLDYTRVRSGTLTLVRRRIDAHQVCRRAVRELQVSHPDRTIVVQAHGDATFDLDPDRLERVLSNLVGNAIKYGAPAEPVMVVTWGEKTMWTLQVSNGGKPIPAELLPRLFSPFERGPQSEGTVKQSLGLGLYIVQELVKAHGGTVSVSSGIGRTVFTVRLPRYKEGEERDDPLHSSGGG